MATSRASRSLARAGRLALLVAFALATTAPAGDIQVFCEPGLRVSLDGELAAISSRLDDGAYLLDVAPGRHTVQVDKDGYRPQSFAVVVGAVPVEVTVGDFVPLPTPRADGETVAAAPPLALGSLVVSSAPQTCVVSVDGTQHTKTTPQLTIGGLSAGAHTVSFEKPGYAPLSAVVTVHPGALVAVRGNLKATRVEVVHQGKGSLRVISQPTRCTVRILDLRREKTDLNLNLTGLPAGEHPIAIAIPGRELTTKVLISDGHRTILRVSFVGGDEPFKLSWEPE